jgi:hypothetical protein
LPCCNKTALRVSWHNNLLDTSTTYQIEAWETRVVSTDGGLVVNRDRHWYDVCIETHGRTTTTHEIYNKGDPHPKLESFQDLRNALVEYLLFVQQVSGRNWRVCPTRFIECVPVGFYDMESAGLVCQGN